jgi:hypothetical protein
LTRGDPPAAFPPARLSLHQGPAAARTRHRYPALATGDSKIACSARPLPTFTGTGVSGICSRLRPRCRWTESRGALMVPGLCHNGIRCRPVRA